MEIQKCDIHVYENSSTVRICLMCVFSVWSGPSESDVFHLRLINPQVYLTRPPLPSFCFKGPAWFSCLWLWSVCIEHEGGFLCVCACVYH